ncbi:MAG: hypothetical protein DIU78_001910 [Pseudomonadota bacterium]|nr:MAG: hypothetical protein DIU78_12360 [Pseudomonadota bacterium]
MTIELLIQAIVRQTTILIGQLATAGGTRAPLAQVANQVFLDLVRELERQGVSRKVSADMFGMGLRTYQRKIQRLTESTTDKGRSLWVAVFDYVQSRGVATRAEVLLHFSRDDEAQVRSVLYDLCESGLLTVSGTGPALEYRPTPEEQLAEMRRTRRTEGLDELLWALIYREGPLTRQKLVEQHADRAMLEAALERLVAAGRVEYSEAEDCYRASTLFLPLGSSSGWEAAVFDHFKAMVNTITGRLRALRSPHLADRIGGSTYTLEVWPGHPQEEEVYGTLARMRAALGELRRRVEAYNAAHSTPPTHDRVLLYVGQCVIPQEGSAPDEKP